MILPLRLIKVVLRLSEYIKCELCGRQYTALGRHLKCSHGIDVFEYRRKFPGALTITESLSKCLSDVDAKRWSDPVYHQQVAASIKQSCNDPAYCSEHSQAIQEAFDNDPQLGRRVSETSLVRWADPVYAEQVSNSQKRRWADPVKHDAIVKAIAETYRIFAVGKKISATLKENYQRDPTISMGISETLKGLWKDPEFAKKMITSWSRSPNFSELQLQSVLDKHFPGTFEFVGDCVRGG